MIELTAGSYKNIGDDLIDNGRYEEAIIAYDEALKLNPNPDQIFEILNNKSCALLELHGYSKARECLEEALTIAPKEKIPDILLNIGAALEQRRCLTEAIEIYENALELSPNNPDILNNIGIAFARSDKYEESFHYFDCALMIPGPHQRTTQRNIENAQYSKQLHERWLQLMHAKKIQ